MADLIRVIGTGPGHPRYLSPEARELIAGADVLVGGEKVLSRFGDPAKEQYIIRHNLAEMAEFIEQRREKSKVAVLASGDPSFYGILEFLKRRFTAADLMVVPGISSVQLACARLGLSWHDAVFYSAHGRDITGLAELVKQNGKVVVLTDPKHTPAAVALQLAEAGVNAKKIFVCENLSEDDESVREFAIDNIPAEAGEAGCVVVITDE